MKRLMVVVVVALTWGCVEEDNGNLGLAGEGTTADPALTPLEEQQCLADCQWKTRPYCDGIASEHCQEAQIECRAECGDSCAVQTFDEFYWCTWEATSQIGHATCLSRYCDRVKVCPWLDQGAAQYALYYCN